MGVTQIGSSALGLSSKVRLNSGRLTLSRYWVSMVMVREEGTCDWFVLNGDWPLDRRVSLAHAFCDLLAEVHRVDWRAIGLDRVLSDPGPDASLVAVDLWDDILHRHQLEAHPELGVVAAWLRANAPRSQATVLVHADWKPGNALLRDERIGVMLDWELAHLGDPMEDLGWLCVKAWRFGVDKPVGGFGDYDELFAAYEGAAGRAVDPEVVRWWEVLGTLKWGIMCIMQRTAHTSGMVRSVELAAIGRRVCENEWDLLNMLGGSGVASS